MRKIIFILFINIPFIVSASPYADAWLYEEMKEFINNQDNYTVNNNLDIIIRDNDTITGYYAEDAFEVYKKEEEYSPLIESCGKGCFYDNSTVDILEAYKHFYYRNAISIEYVKNVIINPPLKSIEYNTGDIVVKYNWINPKHLRIDFSNSEYIDFTATKTGVKITTTFKDLLKYVL